MKKLFYLLPLFLVYRLWISLGVLCKGDCVYFYRDNLLSFFNFPYFWNTSPAGSGLGYFSLPTLPFAPPSFLLGLAYRITGFDFSIIEKIIWFLPFLVISYFGIRKLGEIIDLDETGKSFTVLFFLLNTYILMVLDGGQIGIALGYSILPWVLYFHFKAISGFERLPVMLSSLFAAFLGLFDLRIAYLAGFLIIFYYVYEYFVIGGKSVKRIIQILSSDCYFGLLINLFWIYPLISSRLVGLNTSLLQANQVSALSWMNLLNGLFIFQPHWYLNQFGKINPTPFYFVLIPVLTFGNLLIQPKNKKVYFWVFICFVSIFLIKGSQEPLSDFYQKLFTFLPGFILFRDPSKFYIPLMVSSSLLFGLAVQKINQWLLTKKYNYVSTGLRILLVVYFVGFTFPVWWGSLLGTFSPLSPSIEYQNYKDLISRQTDFFRTAWYPQKSEFGYSSPLHPAVDATYDLFHLRPFDIAIGGTYDLFSYLEHSFTPQLFDVLGVRYLVQSESIRNYPKTKDDIKNSNRLTEVLSKAKWLTRINLNEKLAVYDTGKPSDHFFFVKNTLGVIGSDDLFWTLGSFSDFKLQNIGLVYFDNYPNKIAKSVFDNIDYLVFNNKSSQDLSFLLADRSKFVSPVVSIGELPKNNKSWIALKSADNIAWRDILAQKAFGNIDFDYGGGFLYADDFPQQTKVPFNLKQNIQGNLYLRYFSNRLGGSFDITIDNLTPIHLNTKSLRDNFIWVDLGEIQLNKGAHYIKFANRNGFNTVNLFGIFSQSDIKALANQAKQIIDSKKEIYLLNGGEATQSAGFSISKSGDFDLLVQPSSTHKVSFCLNDQNYSFQALDNWVDIGKVKLKAGINQIVVQEGNIEKYLFYEDQNQGFFDFLKNSENNFEVISKAINPTKYLLTINNSTPGTLVFSESFHPYWQLSNNNQLINSFLVYEMLNGFQISDSGSHQYLLEFTPQQLFLPSFIISLFGLILILVLIGISHDK
jgi:hypothetical protein